jgi:hypothetical protein
MYAPRLKSSVALASWRLVYLYNGLRPAIPNYPKWEFIARLRNFHQCCNPSRNGTGVAPRKSGARKKDEMSAMDTLSAAEYVHQKTGKGPAGSRDHTCSC